MRYDSITVSSAWELTSVSIRFSQGDRVNTSLSRIMYCTQILVQVPVYCVVPFLYVYGYFSRHGHVLPRTLIIKIMCGNHLYLQG